MHRLALLAASAALIAAAGAAQAASFTYTTIDDPADPTFNQLLGINNAGVISGYFGMGNTPGHPNKGYTVAPPYTTFKSDNVPGSAQTQAVAINNAKMTAGFWASTNNANNANFGFIRSVSNGTYQYLQVNDPMVSSNPPVNQLLGINDSQNAVGFYLDAANNSHGFAYSVSTGRYTPINVPGAVSAAATGINNSNLICGFFTGATRTVGFVKPLGGGGDVNFSVPNSPNTSLFGVNNLGQVVGSFVGPSDGLMHGVLYTPSTGVWQQIDDPDGALGTVLNGLNDKNQLVGFYTDAATNVHGLLVTVTP